MHGGIQRTASCKADYKQEKIDKWLNKEFPGITERVKGEDAEIFFGDETNAKHTKYATLLFQELIGGAIYYILKPKIQ